LNNLDTEIPIKDLYDFWIKDTLSVVHCGAHLAEELEEYEALGWVKIIWIEANSELIPALCDRLKDHKFSEVYNSALWSKDGHELELKIANNSYSSSLLKLGTHASTYPEIVFEKLIKVQSETLDSLMAKRPRLMGALLCLDLQGVELDVLKGATNSLADFDFIYTEVSKGGLYQDQGKWAEITKFLAGHNFKLADWQYSAKLNWGNALYQRNGRPLQILRSRTLRKMHHLKLQKSSQFPK